MGESAEARAELQGALVHVPLGVLQVGVGGAPEAFRAQTSTGANATAWRATATATLAMPRATPS